jgi:protein involved in polysaccharide export with SLBB domain
MPRRVLIYWVAGLCLLVGCAQGGAVVVAPPKAPPPSEYRIQRGDELEIRFALNPEFDSDNIVLPDGNISLQLVGDLYADGLTPAELTERLRNAYSIELRDPDIAVNVKSMAARVYVGGHIERPGEYPWSRQITAMQAIARAGAPAASVARPTRTTSSCCAGTGPARSGRSRSISMTPPASTAAIATSTSRSTTS